MATVRCVLSIRLDAAEFHQGSAITGEVVVRISEPVHCNGLSIACAWFTRGTCPHEKHALRRIPLFQGPWAPDEHRYRFAASVPRGPLSYDSEMVSIAWCVDVRAELAWSRDASASAEFRLCPKPDVRREDAYSFGMPQPVASGPPGTPSSDFPAWGRRGAWWLLYAKLATFAPTLLYGAPVAMAAPFLLARFRRQKPGIVEIRAVPRATCLGETIEATTILVAPHDVRIDACSVELHAVARWLTDNNQIAERTLYSHVEPLSLAGQTRRKGEHAAESKQLSIPADGPCTFFGVHSEIVWRVQARMKHSGGKSGARASCSKYGLADRPAGCIAAHDLKDRGPMRARSYGCRPAS
ncbi:hypothetical protein [Nannocystis pusilla]|uniref:hypothetical protein n=1 Tax=Nannocystis pusilla TaxID=889268 RepID=UPI003B821B33